MDKRLEKEFFAKSAPELAAALIGKTLCRRTEGKIIRLPVTETEAYFGAEDTACHAAKGRTKRTEILWAEGGRIYVYLCYGIHEMLNIVSGDAGHPEAVLIRGAGEYDGPGKLTRALNITRAQNGVDAAESHELWFEDSPLPARYEKSPRIGIAYAAPADREKLWRFHIKTD